MLSRISFKSKGLGKRLVSGRSRYLEWILVYQPLIWAYPEMVDRSQGSTVFSVEAAMNCCS